MSGNHALATLYALQEDRDKGNDILRYSGVNETDSLRIESSGRVVLGESLNSARVANVTIRAAVEDSSGIKNFTSFRVNLYPVESLDCDFLIEDLCYWQTVTYRIFENRKGSVIGSLSSPYLVDLCEGFKMNYTLIEGGIGKYWGKNKSSDESL